MIIFSGVVQGLQGSSRHHPPMLTVLLRVSQHSIDRRNANIQAAGDLCALQPFV